VYRHVVVALLAAALLPLSCDTPTNAPELLMIVHIRGVLTVGPDSAAAAGASVSLSRGGAVPRYGSPYPAMLGGRSTTDDAGAFELQAELYRCPQSRVFQTSAGLFDRTYPFPAPEWECTPELQEVHLHVSPAP